MENDIDREIMQMINQQYEEGGKDELLWEENVFINYCFHVPYEHRQRGALNWVYRTPTRLATAWMALLIP